MHLKLKYTHVHVHTHTHSQKHKGIRQTNLDGFKPAWLFYLVVDDRLVLQDALVSSTREHHVLKERERERWKWRVNFNIIINTILQKL